jgi:hypothetical protein
MSAEAGDAACSSREVRVQNAAILELPNASRAEGEDRLRALVLARIACCPQGATKAETAMDVAAISGTKLAAGQLRKWVEREITVLTASGLAGARQGRLTATAAGTQRTARFLGLAGDLPRRWIDVRDQRLVALALGMQHEPTKRLQMLATPDGLRIAILETSFKLRVKGVPTAARVREALAAAALRRAFGNKSTTELAGKLGLSAKASRLLAAQLSRKPRDFGTDSRLIATLAGECVGASSTDPEAVRLALLRQFFAMPAKSAPARKPAAKRPAIVEPVPAPPARPTPPAAEVRPVTPPPSAPQPSQPPLVGRPDLSGFATEVRRQAASTAHGWSGDRKAYISHVWRNVRDQHPGWNLSEIEFKCMLAEAHRSGQLALAHADLKDNNNIKDVQESAVVYRNAVFHLIRVD